MTADVEFFFHFPSRSPVTDSILDSSFHDRVVIQRGRRAIANRVKVWMCHSFFRGKTFLNVNSAIEVLF